MRIVLASLVLAGLALLGAAAPVSAQGALGGPEMRFRWVAIGDPAQCGERCPKVIEAQGVITTATPQAFLDFVYSTGELPGAKNVVLLHSPGGVLSSGMQLGALFRQLDTIAFVGRVADLRALAAAGLVDPQPARRRGAARAGATPVAGTCVSACVYAFLGGRQRIVPAPSRLGVHRPFRAADRTDTMPAVNRSSLIYWDRGVVMDAQRDYLTSMGVSAQLVDIELTTASDRIRFLTPQEMRRLRLVTGGNQPRVERRRAR